ncbi:MAG: choice-of-anchor Q domain-containing protein [Myxococcota bacterium]
MMLFLGALGALTAFGCSGSDGSGGTGGDAGMGGAGGESGQGGEAGMGGDAGMGGAGGAPECTVAEDCDDGNECTVPSCDEGQCQETPVDDGTLCDGGVCQSGACVESFACTEQGIRDAIAEGGGPHLFSCDGPTLVTTEAEIVIDNDVILDGGGNLQVDGDDSHRVLSVASETVAELIGLEISGGRALIGAGIMNDGTLTIREVTLRSNTQAGPGDVGGGGIFSLMGTVSISDCLIEDNTTEGLGGGVTLQSGTIVRTTVRANTALIGGGVGVGGEVTISDSTFEGNMATNAGAGIFGGPDSSVTITNSTVSSNTVTGQGGGVAAAGFMILNNSTIAGNTAAGAAAIFSGGSLTLTNTLVSGESVASGQVNTGGGNLESPGDTLGLGSGDQVDVSAEDLALGPLQDNGGPTATHALLPGSAAIDQVAVEDCIVDADQRGEPRPGGTLCDTGAFELQ